MRPARVRRLHFIPRRTYHKKIKSDGVYHCVAVMQNAASETQRWSSLRPNCASMDVALGMVNASVLLQSLVPQSVVLQ